MGSKCQNAELEGIQFQAHRGGKTEVCFNGGIVIPKRLKATVK